MSTDILAAETTPWAVRLPAVVSAWEYRVTCETSDLFRRLR